MKKNFLYYICMICIQTLMVCACSDDYSSYTSLEDYKDGELRIKGVIDVNCNSKTVHTENGNSVNVKWGINDKVSIVSAKQKGMYYYKALQTGNETIFTPEYKNTLDYIKGDTVFACYPFVEDDFSYPKISLSSFSGQSYKDDNFPSHYDYIYAKAIVDNENVELRFKHLFAFLKVKIKRSLLENTNMLCLASSDTISKYDSSSERKLYYDIREDKVNGEGSNYLWYYLPKSLPDGKDEIICHFAILPIKEGEDLSVNVVKNNNREALFEGKAPEGGFKAGYIYTLNIEENAYEEIEKIEREALMALYNATDGKNWKDNTNWGSDKPLSEWANVYVWDSHVRYLNLRNNNLQGSIPEEMANLNELQYIDLCGNYLSGKIPQKVLESEWWNELGYDMVIHQQEGYKLDFPMYESTDYSQDGLVTTLQTHTVGCGLKLIVFPEAFSDRMIADGSFLKCAKDAMEVFFEKEPYASFREYFDVYCVNVVSKNEILYGNTAFMTSYEFERMTFDVRPELVVQKVINLKETNYNSANVTTMVIMNTNAPFRAVCSMYGDGFCAGYVLKSTREGMSYLIHHEVCGHGFGKLADEYVEFEGEFPDPEIFEWYHSQNWYKNVDVTNNPSLVQWSYFLSDMRYASEKLGIFEGAYYYPKGVYRPRETSIMVNNVGTFNAPSRLSIYRRIMELSGCEYRFDNFLEYDEINRNLFDSGVHSRSVPCTSSEQKFITAPPQVFGYPSSEALKRSTNSGVPVNVPLK